jgi:hypothetical protein
LAKQQYRRQLSFFPFLRDNVDLICLEPTSGNDVVVFHDHEWSFYERGNSGIRLSDSLLEFWQGWSTVGFIDPTHLWWPATVSDGKVNWSGDCFGFHLQGVT